MRLRVKQSHQTLNAELLPKIKLNLQKKKNKCINRNKHLTFYEDFYLSDISVKNAKLHGCVQPLELSYIISFADIHETLFCINTL